MRTYLLFLALLLAACGDNGSNGRMFPSAVIGPSEDAHVPQVSHLTLSPDTSMYMEGNGSVSMTAEITYTDSGLDIQTLWIETSDGLQVGIPETQDSETGTFIEQITISTEAIGYFNLKVWVADEAGDISNRLSAMFDVVGAAEVGDWTGQLTGLPFVLNDVVWDGDNFVAVGDDGRILTSDDGIAWVERESFTGVNLNAVASHGSDIVAVGQNGTVLLSTDDGESWSIKHSADRLRLAAVVINDSQFVAGGSYQNTGDAFIMRSEDRGDTWTNVESLPHPDHWVTNLFYYNGLFVAATDVNSYESDARVLISLDGNDWHSIVLRDEVAALHAVLHDGNQFVVAGYPDAVFVSADGFNWSELPTPVRQVSYLSGAWNGSKLVLAGGITWWYWWMGTPSFERPVGISSVDGGNTWDIFNIDGYYQSRGMAWGNGRFVSVGQSSLISGEGAIYTSG